MSIVKAHDVAYVRFKAPELGLMRRFLTDFGMTETPHGGDRLFMRGQGGDPFVHVTDLGEPGFAGFGLSLKCEADLQRLADAERVAIEALDAPGGGKVVRLQDPDGVTVEVVAGQEAGEVLTPLQDSQWNEAGVIGRSGRRAGVRRGPSHVLRLGHVVLAVSDFRRSEAWYKERFGLLTSDEIQPAPGVAIGAFLRADRGDEPCDHHTLFLLERPGPPGFMHAAFEVQSLDDLMVGHEHLIQGGYRHQWGIGRHRLGSQVFDYWLDPYGHELEHWTDGDRLRARDGGGIGSIEDLMGVQWGAPMPPIAIPEETA